MKSLQALYLVGTKVKGSGLKELAGLKNLQVLLTIPELVRNAVEHSLPFMENGRPEVAEGNEMCRLSSGYDEHLDPERGQESRFQDPG